MFLREDIFPRITTAIFSSYLTGHERLCHSLTSKLRVSITGLDWSAFTLEPEVGSLFLEGYRKRDMTLKPKESSAVKNRTAVVEVTKGLP